MGYRNNWQSQQTVFTFFIYKGDLYKHFFCCFTVLTIVTVKTLQLLFINFSIDDFFSTFVPFLSPQRVLAPSCSLKIPKSFTSLYSCVDKKITASVVI